MLKTGLRTIVKRDGRVMLYDESKITNAIYKALSATGQENWDIASKVARTVGEELSSRGNTDGYRIEEIQDEAEKVLMQTGYTEAAKHYILYRAQRTHVRESNTALMRICDEITNSDAKESNLKRDNANVDGNTAMGSMLQIGSAAAKTYNEAFLLTPDQARAHKEGYIHIHDFDFYSLTTTCCQIDLLKLFHGGFSTGHGFLREPSDIASYSALACIAIQSNQNDQHGGQSIPNFEYSLAPGVAKTYRRLYTANLARALSLLRPEREWELEDVKAIVARACLQADCQPALDMPEEYLKIEFSILSESETSSDDTGLFLKAQAFAQKNAGCETNRAVYQAMEAFIHNLNSMHSRAGAQTPFSSINYGTDTSAEGRMIMKNVLLATEAGLGHGETPIFPIQIFKLKAGVNYNIGDPNYDLFELACRCSAKRLFPNFTNLDAPFNLQYYKPGHPETEVATMGCRTRVMGNRFDPECETAYGRGNLSFTSINLPRLAIESGKDESKFFHRLDLALELVSGQLLDRFEIQAKKKVKNFPFLMGQGIWIGSDKLGPDDEIREVLKHGTLTVGFIGLAETLTSLYGAHHGQSDEIQEKGLAIVRHMREFTDRKSEETNLNFSLIATPAEGLSGRFVRMDHERYGSIPGVTDREYYTNSFHIPVYYDISVFDKIKKEAPYHELTNGGHITYVELDGDTTNNLEAFISVVRCMHDANVGYGSINHPIDRDPVCGYNGIIGEECPQCHRHEFEGPDSLGFERIRRITGYLVGTLDRFNDAKRAEEKERVKHGLHS